MTDPGIRAALEWQNREMEPEELFGDGQAALEELRERANPREFTVSEGSSAMNPRVAII
ncbi:hypothetical protein [Streptomyces sp. NPDC000880]